MGYSIGIRAKSSKLQQQMLAFMREHYRNWPTIEGRPEGNAYMGSPSDDLWYDGSKRVVGLNYGPISGWERIYAYVIVRWMALKIGTLRSTFKGVQPSKTSKPVPYMVYDGDESWPILVVTTPKQLDRIPKTYRWCAFTPLGLYAELTSYMSSDVVIWLAEDTNKMFKEVDAKIGEAPKGEGPQRQARFDAWVKRRHRLMLPYCRKKLKAGVKLLETEMQRLDNLWNESL